jgi:hypothetical protein
VQDVFADGLDTIPLPADATLPAAPTPAAPDDGTTGQPVTPTLHWNADENASAYQLELATDAAFTSAVARYIISGSTSLTLDTLALYQTYYWRLRAENEAGYSPFSTPRSFSTADYVIREPDVLLLSDGSPAFVEIAGPGGRDPCGPDARDTFGCTETGGNLVHMSFNSDSSYVMKAPSQSVSLFAPNDFEIRFTEEGSYARYWNQGEIGVAPFEVWDIGPTGPFGDNDPTDDVQLVPALSAESDEAPSIFQYGHGWPGDPFQLGWPSTEAIDAFYPRDGTTYQDFADLAAAGPLPRAVNRDTLFDTLLDGHREALSRVVFFGNRTSPTYRLQGPAEGTVIRFYSTPFGLAPATPAAPRDGADGLPQSVTLWWHPSPGGRYDHLQISTQPDFATLIVDEGSLFRTTQYTLDSLTAGATYYWRLRTLNGVRTTSAWSDPWRFTVGPETGTDSETTISELPAAYTLLPNYPNPFNPTTTIGFGLPESGPVRLSVYNVLGQRVATLVDDALPAGWHTAAWDARRVSSGLYVYRLETDARALARTMLLIK